ncbi:MAG TPA: carbohydrate ABC transporter permease [Mobilitalea sp.]|nr:carbohydrate ABC transporter permease [Mobilitalea sp.]
MINKLGKKKDMAYFLRKKTAGLLFIIFRYVLLITLGFVIITPLLKLLKSALTDPSALGLNNSKWFPPAVSTEAFQVANILINYWKALGYTLANTAFIVFLQTFSAALAGYSFARIKFKGSKILFGLVILTIIVPVQSVMLAQYIAFRNFDIFGLVKLITGEEWNLLGNPIAIYILAATDMGLKGGLYIYIFRQFFRNLPVSIEEAAFVDGAGFLQTFFRIVLPSSRSSVMTVAVLSFVWNFGDTYYTALLNPTKYHMALRLTTIYSSVIQALKTANNNKLIPPTFDFIFDNPLYQNAVASACSLLVIIPLLIIYLFIQKKFVQGVERSGLGGE